jgi:hypothetical protein
MFTVFFFLGVIIAGLVVHIVRLRAEIAQADFRNAELESLWLNCVTRRTHDCEETR